MTHLAKGAFFQIKFAFIKISDIVVKTTKVKVMSVFYKILFFSLFFVLHAVKAQEPVYLHTKSYACEEIKAEEGKSAARAKVADKAGFAAAEQLNLVQQYRNNFNEHDFNVMVYELVDGVLEGVSIQTISEDEKQICVEINAMVQEKNLREEISKHLKERGEKAPTDIVVEALEDVIATKEKFENTEFASKPMAVEDCPLVFVAPTVFYNGANSENHSKLLRHYLADNEKFYLTNEQEIADFIIYPKVKKAMMDESRDGIKRLQMQIQFMLVSSDGEMVAKDEQSRAIICDENKTEQQNAQELLKKMFAKSAKRIAAEIEKIKLKK